ncbi:hypothetical protein SUDANB105_07991 [Streptomyces sp. enrichment culture]|uniref:hypothetical protein n=1 Tax=Streptomyces sp. enrichment culture TaxID=1795815 RepID=UPI003F54F36C
MRRTPSQPPRPAANRSCRNCHCRSPFQALSDDSPDTYCIVCADLADDHDQGAHDYDSHEHCPACQPT